MADKVAVDLNVLSFFMKDIIVRTSITRDVRFDRDKEPTKEEEVIDKIISYEGSVKRGRSRPDGVGVLEIFKNLTSSQNST